LYRPIDLDTDLPCVVMAHGLGLLREARLPSYAELFARAGLSALVFDYRHFGSSGGQPRQLLDIGRQLADWRAAIEFSRSLDGVDPNRIALWGTSFGGGHVIEVAAGDTRLAAVVAQCPFTDGIASATRLGPLSTIRVSLAAIADQFAAVAGLAPVRVSAAGRRGSAALMTTHDAESGYESLSLDATMTRLAARVALRIPFYRPGRAAASIRSPLLVCVCTEDSVAPPGPSRRVAERALHGRLREYPIGHFDIYHGDWFDRAAADQLAFLREHLT
jgi:dienelactone hydrolase